MQTLQAQPQGAEVANGTATFHQPDANTLNITTSNGAILNWQQFNLQNNETTRFIQQGATSAVLNRVVGQTPSAILGQLISNGRVFIINPNGIVFGPNAKVDTAGLIASTLNMTDADFIAGKLQFAGDKNAGSIRNEGYLKAGPHGEIVLIAPQIENRGTLTVVEGRLILAAGEKVRLAGIGPAGWLDDITFEVQAPTNQAINLGQLIAEKGAVGVFAGSIKHSGLISANSIGTDAQGRIVLSATNDITLAANATLSANGTSGAKGGDIRVISKDGTTLSSAGISARSDTTFGGDITLLGENVGLIGNGSLDASGNTGGGTIRIGGDWQGSHVASTSSTTNNNTDTSNNTLANAQQVYLGAGTAIAANALTSGNGGKVVVWADGDTRYYGSIAAQGGTQSGNGGNVEVSGHERLAFDGAINTSANNLTGRDGNILLDPNNGTIQAAAAGPGADDAQLNAGVPVGQPAGSILFADGGAANFVIGELALEALTGTIDLQFSGDLTVLAGTTLNLVNQITGTVSFRAGGNLNLNGLESSSG